MSGDSEPPGDVTEMTERRAEPGGAGSDAGQRPTARRAMVIGGLSLLVCIVSFVGQTAATRRVQETFEHPYLILWISHSFWIIMLPLHTAVEKLKRRPRTLAALRTEVLVAGVDADGVRVRATFKDDEDEESGAEPAAGSIESARALAARRPWWVVVRVAALAAALVGLLNASAYLWYVAVALTSMSKVTAIYNTSCFFAYLFSVLLLGERVRLAKCAAVGVSIVGVVLMALAGPDAGATAATRSSELLGDALSLACACGIGLYQVLYKKYAVPRDFHSLYAVNFMTSLLGLSTLALCWLPVPALHAARIERFALPNRAQALLICANALAGVAFNAGFMIALALTSPLFAAVGVMLTIPVMAVVDMAMQGQLLAWNVFVGGAAILAGFSILTLAEYHDSVRKAQRADDDNDD
ncbi:hypothetical protein LPJ63_000420 [Coemansia sp. RSA 2711]|nr:hypothetical protein LPJ63_000420 [Coemansia sp. RSA 2711]